MTPEIQAQLERYLPIRVVVRVKDGKVEGQVENSFSMDWQTDRVNIYWSGKAFSLLGEHKLDATTWAARNVDKWNPSAFVLDPLAEDSPIEIDWERWLAANNKFDKRNAFFKVKPFGDYKLRALAAERELAELKPKYDRRGEYLESYQKQWSQINAILNPQDVQPNEEDDQS